jgi:hypothetical protein
MALDITAPFVDDDLTAHRAPLINNMLTGRNAPTPGLEAAIVQMASAVTHQATEVRNSRLAREVERDAPTLPSVKFGRLIDLLLNYLNVQEEAQLPEFLFQFVASSKKQEFSIICEWLDSTIRVSSSSTVYIDLGKCPLTPDPSGAPLNHVVATTSGRYCYCHDGRHERMFCAIASTFEHRDHQQTNNMNQLRHTHNNR